jgi:dephospho-CoA kinase
MSTENDSARASRPRRPRGADGLFIVGLVGRAGSGKGAVAAAWSADGALAVEADRVGHEVTDSDPDVRAGLVAEYGPDVYDDAGRLDRERVAARVFADPAARARLDRLVHPALVAGLRRRLEVLRARGWRGTVVLDAALLLEWGMERECDAVVAVTAPEPEQLRRLMQARGWSADQARRRLAAQRTNEAFAAAADAVIENAGSPAELAVAARATLDSLRAARAEERDPC